MDPSSASPVHHRVLLPECRGFPRLGLETLLPKLQSMALKFGCPDNPSHNRGGNEEESESTIRQGSQPSEHILLDQAGYVESEMK
jgi:hypothetical protein